MIHLEIETRKDPNSSIARVIIAGDWKGDLIEAKRVLEKVCEKWEEWLKDTKVNFLITCGGFIQFPLPEYISSKGDKLNPNKESVETLVKIAEENVRKLLDDDLEKKLKEFTDYITLGVDSYKEKISTTYNYINELHIELVFLKDLKKGNLYWTGKSYPTKGQERGIIRIADLETHFLELDIGKVMLLGCHDLTIFNPRSKNAKGWRKEVRNKFIELAIKEQPRYVITHPHTTIKVRTWKLAWSGLTEIIPSVKYASAGRYYEPDRDPSTWDILDEVLKSTKNTDTIDFIVWIK